MSAQKPPSPRGAEVAAERAVLAFSEGLPTRPPSVAARGCAGQARRSERRVGLTPAGPFEAPLETRGKQGNQARRLQGMASERLAEAKRN